MHEPAYVSMSDEEYNKERDVNLKELAEPMPYKWRIQSYSKNKPAASCVAYIDARDVQQRLDDVCGPENWQVKYEVINNRLFASIGIKCGEEWVWKQDVGTESNMEKEKGQASDAMKRAAVNWGVGRFLYSLKIIYLKANAVKSDGVWPHPVTDDGKRIWDITAHINEWELDK